MIFGFLLSTASPKISAVYKTLSQATVLQITPQFPRSNNKKKSENCKQKLKGVKEYVKDVLFLPCNPYSCKITHDRNKIYKNIVLCWMCNKDLLLIREMFIIYYYMQQRNTATRASCWVDVVNGALELSILQYNSSSVYLT